jgi:hypothetical protein
MFFFALRMNRGPLAEQEFFGADSIGLSDVGLDVDKANFTDAFTRAGFDRVANRVRRID